MGFNRALQISVSAIEAERLHMEVISSNIANINTTRTLDGGPYRRLSVSFENEPLSFQKELNLAENRLMSKLGDGGVKAKLVEDMTPFKKVYNPSHPDSDKNGYVLLPNVDLASEMVALVESSKLHEANITVYNTTKKMIQDVLQLP